MKFLHKIRAFLRSDYPTYLISLALAAAVVVAVFSPRTDDGQTLNSAQIARVE